MTNGRRGLSIGKPKCALLSVLVQTDSLIENLEIIFNEGIIECYEPKGEANGGPFYLFKNAKSSE